MSTQQAPPPQSTTTHLVPQQPPTSKAKLLQTAEEHERDILTGISFATLSFAPFVYTAKVFRGWRGPYLFFVAAGVSSGLKVTTGAHLPHYAGWPARQFVGMTKGGAKGIEERARIERERVERMVEEAVRVEEERERVAVESAERRRRAEIEFEIGLEEERRVEEEERRRKEGWYRWAFFWDRGEIGGRERKG